MSASTRMTFRLLGKDESAGKTFDAVGGKMDRLGKKSSGLGKKVAAAFSAAVLVRFGSESVAAFKESEEAQKRLAFAFEKFPKLADSSAAKLQKLNTQWQKKSKFDDDAIASGQAVVAQFGLTGKQLEEVTPLLLDYASMTGKTLPDAGQDLGKALLGNAKALKNIGIKYTATGDSAKDFANITALLRRQVGGFAEREGKTAAGKAAILRNQFGELEEKVGARLVPALSALADIGLKVVGFIDRNGAVLLPLIAAIGVVVAGVKAYTVAQAALNIVMAMNPIALVVLAVAALVAGIVVAWKKSETFRTIVTGAFNGIKTVVGNAVAFMIRGFRGMLMVWLTVADGIISGAAAALGWVPGIGSKLKAANTAFDKFKDDTLATLDRLADEADGLGEKIGLKIKAGFYRVVGANGLTTSVMVTPNGRLFEQGSAGLPGRASGGPVFAGRAYTVGENGPETLVMGSQGGNIVSYGAAEMTAGATIINHVVVELDGDVVYQDTKRRSVRESARTKRNPMVATGIA